MPLRTPLVPARRVRRMHVRAHADDDARHAATLLADALRTASLPAPDDGRLVVVRRLALGRISVRVSPSSLALHIERVAHDVMSQAVTFDVPAAGAANAVVFPDRSDAIVALAGVYAGGASADEWFWPEVVDGWRADASRAERWLLLLQAAHGVPGAAIVAAAVIDRAIRAGVEDALLSSVPTGQGARWLRLEGWTSLSPDAAPPIWRPPAPLFREVIHRWRGTWGPDDDRLIWLATHMTVLQHPACAADRRLPGRVAFALRTVPGLGAQQSVSSQQQDQQPGAILPGQDAIGIVTRADPTVEGDEEPEASERAGSLRSGPRPGGVDAGPRVASADRSWPAPTADRTFERFPDDAPHAGLRPKREPQPFEGAAFASVDDVFTSFAGLLFVVPILERLGFSTFLASHPAFLAGGLPTRVLWFIGQRVGLPSGDPLALSFRAELAGEDDPALFGTADVTFTLPAPAAEILSAPEPRAPLDSPCTAWLTAVRRWSRRHARMGLTTLIRRPGRVHISRTHIAAGFALSQIDVRLRRLALDVDPGWVPWMGRVVQFNYGERHDRG